MSGYRQPRLTILVRPLRYLLLVGSTILLMLAGSSLAAQEQTLGDLSTVLDDLRRGGFVIYFRHAATMQSDLPDAQADLDRCDTQRNLSSEGREQAVRIGAAFRTLGIPVGTVLSSPFCRCQDTAQLAFGRFTVHHDLYFAIGVDAKETQRLAAALRRMLSTPPAAGTNTVIVAHTANLRETAGIWPKPEGVAYVFRPLPGGRFEAVAKVLPDQWIDTRASMQSGDWHQTGSK